ncbi:hypothetical protein TRICI_002676 [Trichomonascus ciferrii]|uniref:Spindle pole body component n=1 Tax=Trichomonascus ciferrii TaxID=44093 RepID=A0A642V653_9ASCO|nr:hypothetical protein TRICI_002676 [Trichomonascus ciferrii]
MRGFFGSSETYDPFLSVPERAKEVDVDVDESLLFRRAQLDFDAADNVEFDTSDPFGLNGSETVSEGHSEGSTDVLEIPEVEDGVLPFEKAKEPLKKTRFSWDEFYNIKELKQRVSPSVLLSERRDGNGQLDAIINNVEESLLIPTDLFLSCLSNVSLGRESLMFRFSRTRLVFKPVSPNHRFRISGCTAESLQGIADFCVKCGSQLMRLKYTVEMIQQKSSSPVLIAFADCLDRIGKSIESNSEALLRLDNETIVGLYNVVRPAARIVDLLTNLLGCGDISIPVRLNRLPKPWTLLNALYTRTLVFESSDSSLFHLTKLVLQRTSSSWLRSLEDIIGLGNQETFWRTAEYITESADSFVQVDDENSLLKLNPDKIPIFLDHQLAHLALQTLNCFMILARHGRRNINEALYALKKIKLDWCFNSKELSLLNTTLAEYKQRVEGIMSEGGNVLNQSKKHCSASRKAVESSRTDSSDDKPATSLIGEADPGGLGARPQNTPELQVTTMLQAMDGLTVENDEGQDEIGAICEHILMQKTGELGRFKQEIPMVICSAESFEEAIRLQNHLANKLVLDMFRQPDKLNLESHTILLRQVYLLGSGKLTGDIEYMLFDNPTGLNMVERPNWPPSASEINQTLSLVVEDTVESLPIAADVKRGGFLNFGLSTAGKPCTDSRKLKAIDELKLCYSVPEPLSLIITSKVCRMYDQVFSRLMRLLYTMHFLKSKQMMKRQEYQAARHFLWAVAGYIINNIINYHWKHFEEHNADSFETLVQQYHTTAKHISDDILIQTSHLDTIMSQILTDQPYEFHIHQLLDLLRHDHVHQQLQVMINYNSYYQ